MTDIQQIAQEFADRHAVRVFPFKIDENGKKHPMVGQWNRAASRDASRFDWRGADGYGVMPDGHTVIDFDTAEAGREFGERVGRPQIDTLVVKTPRGIHMWFRGVTKHANGLIPNVDVRSGSEKGWIVGPGSVDPSRQREWKIISDTTVVSEIPPRIRDFIMNPGEPVRVRESHADQGWEDLLGHGRNVALTSLKGTLLRNGVPEATANDMVRAANASLPEPLPERELESTVLAAKEDWERGRLELPRVASDLELLTVEELASQPPPEFVIDPIFPEGTVNVMFGAPGSYKSFVALDWAARISIGLPLPSAFPHLPPVGQVPRPRRVLYVAAEGKGGLGKRVRSSEAISSSDILVHPDSLNLRDPEHVKLIGDLIYEQQFEVVFYDTLRKMAPGADENKVQDMGVLMTNLERLSNELSATMVLVHHSNRTAAGDYRGSSAIEGDAYNMWKVEHLEDDPALTARVSSYKFKDAEPTAMMAQLAVNTQWNSLYVDYYTPLTEEYAETLREAAQARREEEGTEVRTSRNEAHEELVIDAIRRVEVPRTPALAEELGWSENRVETTLARLRAQGRVRFAGSGRTGSYVILDTPVLPERE